MPDAPTENAARREDVIEAVEKALHDFRFIPDAGDGHPSIRSGSDRDLAIVAVDAMEAFEDAESERLERKIIHD